MISFPDVTVFHRGEMIGEISGFVELDCDFKWSGVDTCTIKMPGVPNFMSGFDTRGSILSGHPIYQLTSVWMDIVVHDTVPWTGHITEIRVNSSRDKGMVTEIEAVGARMVLEHLLLYPDPFQPLGLQKVEEFRQSGILDEVFHGVISQAAQRQDVPVVYQPGASERASTRLVTVSGRMETLAKALGDAADSAGVGLRCRFWYPGIGMDDSVDQPGTVIVDCPEPTENPGVLWGQDDLVDGGLLAETATAMEMVIGGDGQGADRKYWSSGNTLFSHLLMPWGGLQRYVDSPSSSDADPQQLSIRDEVRQEMNGRTTMSMTVQDGAPFAFGRDYKLGDIVFAQVAGVKTKATITEVNVNFTASGGKKVTPKIGEGTVKPMDKLIGVVASLARAKDLSERSR